MKIAILYISTGRYSLFWPGFYKSCQAEFIPEAQKDFFVFSDNLGKTDGGENCVFIQQPNLGWPDNTLKRFHIFLSIRETLETYDFVFFFNANCEALGTIPASFLPEKDQLVFTQHPGYWNKPRHSFPYETNPKSAAYIAEDEGTTYVAGGLNGGGAKAYLRMCEDLAAAIDSDRDKGLIAVWHDESHLNRYYLSHGGRLWDPGFLWPEGWKIPQRKRIAVRDKRFHGGHKFLRGESDQFQKAPLRKRIRRALSRLTIR